MLHEHELVHVHDVVIDSILQYAVSNLCLIDDHQLKQQQLLTYQVHLVLFVIFMLHVLSEPVLECFPHVVACELR